MREYAINVKKSNYYFIVIKFVCFTDFLSLSMSVGGEDLDDSIMISPGVM